MSITTKRIYYHGTCADNLPTISTHGLSCNESKLWNVSHDAVYLWSADAMGKAWGCETTKECEERAFQMAFESAQFACAVATNCKAVVLRIELEADEVMEDYSCENMADLGAVYVNRTISPFEITEIKVSNDISLLKGYFMGLAINNQYSAIELNRMEKRIAEAFIKAEIYHEDVEDMTEWKVLPLPKKLKTA